MLQWCKIAGKIVCEIFPQNQNQNADVKFELDRIASNKNEILRGKSPENQQKP